MARIVDRLLCYIILKWYRRQKKIRKPYLPTTREYHHESRVLNKQQNDTDKIPHHLKQIQSAKELYEALEKEDFVPPVSLTSLYIIFWISVVIGLMALTFIIFVAVIAIRYTLSNNAAPLFNTTQAEGTEEVPQTTDWPGTETLPDFIISKTNNTGLSTSSNVTAFFNATQAKITEDGARTTYLPETEAHSYFIFGLTNTGLTPNSSATAVLNTTPGEIPEEADLTTNLPGTDLIPYDIQVTINPLEDISKISPSFRDVTSMPPPTVSSAAVEDSSRSVKTKCTLGASSFKELNQPEPPNVLNCRPTSSYEMNSASNTSSMMYFMKCEDPCSYIHATLTDLSFPPLFFDKRHHIGAMTIDTSWYKNCKDVNVSIISHSASFKRLEGLRLKIPYECSEVYEAVSNFEAPLNFLTFENSAISVMNNYLIKDILHRFSTITMLSMINVTLCSKCSIFDDILFENLEVVTLNFTQHSDSSNVSRQLKVLINNCPKLKRITTDAQIPDAMQD